MDRWAPDRRHSSVGSGPTLTRLACRWPAGFSTPKSGAGCCGNTANNTNAPRMVDTRPPFDDRGTNRVVVTATDCLELA